MLCDKVEEFSESILRLLRLPLQVHISQSLLHHDPTQWQGLELM
jgi:hypothetical protein